MAPLGFEMTDLFIDHRVLASLQLAFATNDIEDAKLHLAEGVFQGLRDDMHSRSILQLTHIDYSRLHDDVVYVIADAEVSLKIDDCDWYNMSTILGQCAGYAQMEDLNMSFIMDFGKAYTKVIEVLQRVQPTASFHIFWSPGSRGVRPLDTMKEQLADLQKIVVSIVGANHIPYLCIDMEVLECMDMIHNKGRVAGTHSTRSIGGKDEFVLDREISFS
jgi:hypothetical protein